MKKPIYSPTFSLKLIVLYIGFTLNGYAQETPLPKAKSVFWEKVQIGGGLGLSLGSGYTDITIAPSCIYNFNKQFAFGTGIQYSYLKQKNYYTSNVFGISLIGLFNPIEQIQVSLEVEEVNVNTSYKDLGADYNDNFWNTGLYVGAGYRMNNVTIGGRFNLLFDEDRDLYGQAFMPFIRAYF